MTRYPFGYTLASMTGVCIAVYAALFIIPEYVGALVLVIGLGCGVAWIIAKVRQAFTYGSAYAAEFIAGETGPRVRPEPIIPHNLKDPATGRFISRKAAMRAALERAVGAK